MLLLLAATSQACPTIVTGTSSPLSFDTAQVAIVRSGNRTTFSVSINPTGDQQGFALVLPVPEVLDEDEIHTLDHVFFEMLDGFTAPRHVTDACGGGGDADTDTDTDADSDADTGAVDVKAHYIVGPYDIVILSSEESAALNTWLDTNGYHLPEGAEPRLAEYIDAGSFFLAAKVAEGEEAVDGTQLPPLQLAYDSAAYSIPIRLATLNSPGEQDMVIYAVNDWSEGSVGISNYPSFEVPDTCRWGTGSTDDFAAFYESQFTEAWTAVGDAGWVTEYAGTPYDCNPCTNVWLDPEIFPSLGYTGSNPMITRLHLRYTPDQADSDLTLYMSGIRDHVQQDYADDSEANECVDACDATPDTDSPADDSGADSGHGTKDDVCACDSGAGGSVGLLAMLVGLLRRR